MTQDASPDLRCCPHCRAWAPDVMFGRKLRDAAGNDLPDRPEDSD